MKCPRCGKEIGDHETMFNYSWNEWLCDKCHSEIEIGNRIRGLHKRG